jgi:GT2 family glycosyltransferase
MRCSIILLYYRDPQLTDRALSSIERHTRELDYEIILVCNRVDEEIQSIIRKRGIKKFCFLSTNVGFSRGNNIAFQMAEGEYCCIFNDDLEVLTDGWLSLMLEPFLDPDIGVSAVAVGKVSYIHGKCHTSKPLDDPAMRHRLRKVGYPFFAGGFLAVYRTRDLHLIGGFDPMFTPCSWEDVDICYRLEQLLGRKICLVDGIQWNHPFRVSCAVGEVEYLGRKEPIEQIAERNQRLGYDRWFNKNNE